MADLTDDQKKIVELETTVATLRKEKQDALTQVTTLKKEKQDALTQAETLKTEKEAAEEQSLKVITELKAQLDAKQLGTVKLPTVQVGKDVYELVGGPFMWAGKEVTHERLQEDTKLAAELVKEKVTNLRKVEK